MNELFLMKALGDIPDDLVKCYFDESAASTHAAMSSDSLNRNAADRVGAAQESKMPQKKIVMKKNQARKESSSIHFSRAGIAAVVAVCIGLNAALIYGIGRLKAPDNMAAFSENEMQLHIELVDAMPTGVAVTYQNRSENTYELPLSAEIWQNGKKVESISIVSDLSKIGVTKFPPLEPDQSFDMLYSFDELPHGTYTLMPLGTDETTLSAFGSIDFEISEGYTEMIHIPDMRGMQSETAISQLNDWNIAYDIVNSPRSDEETDHVITALPTPYKTVETAGTQQEYYHYDGNGYWIRPTDRIQLEIAVRDERGPVMLPDMQGWDYDTVRTTVQSLDLYIDKRTAYNDEVPKGTVISIDPEGPIEVERYSTVHVVVSLGSDDNAY